jgi:hypothetical protein
MSTSLSRAFTTRRMRKPSQDVSVDIPQRSLTTKHSFPAGALRHQKISAPLELISTTNMLSYNAPDIYPRSRSSTTSSAASSAGSHTSAASNLDSSPSSVGTPFTSPETSSNESSPTSRSPEPNHLSCYFGTPGQASDDEAPKIPQRALSHTKKSAEYLARKRSISRISSPRTSIQKMTSPKNSISTSRSSINIFSPSPETVESHPFGNELAQVSELVEEYTTSKERLPVVDEEEQELISRGLYKFGAEEYMSELQGLFIKTFGDIPKMSAVWI